MRLTDQSKPRSELIRRRRMNKSHAAQNNLKQIKKRAATPPPPPPVMARRHISGVSKPANKGSKKNRRLFSFNVDSVSRAEMNLPAVPNLGLSWRLASLILAALLGFVLYNFWESAAYRVEIPQISGLNRLNINQLNTELGLVGKPVFALNARTIQADLLEAFPELSAAEVDIELPNTVLITVTERIPVLTWVRNGESFLVDSQGITFPLRKESSTPSIPIIEASGDPPATTFSNDEKRGTLRDETLQKITGLLLPALPAQDQVKPLLETGLVQSILVVSEQAPAGSKLIYDPTHGLGWTDRRGWNVYLGDEHEMAVKLKIYRAIMDELKAHETRPTMISVEYVHAPYYRVE